MPETDYTNLYNTKLPPSKVVAYRNWAKKVGQDPEKGKYDYDLQGAFLANEGTSANGHFSDQFKKPNHPTFSDESQYHGVDGHIGGSWTQQGYQPSFTNLKFHSPEELQQYFKQVEPDIKLLPQSAYRDRIIQSMMPAQNPPISLMQNQPQVQPQPMNFMQLLRNR